MTAELPEATQKDYLSKVPAGRFAEASEVANVVRWIASDEAPTSPARSSRSTAAWAWATRPRTPDAERRPAGCSHVRTFCP